MRFLHRFLHMGERHSAETQKEVGARLGQAAPAQNGVKYYWLTW